MKKLNDMAMGVKSGTSLLPGYPRHRQPSVPSPAPKAVAATASRRSSSPSTVAEPNSLEELSDG